MLKEYVERKSEASEEIVNCMYEEITSAAILESEEKDEIELPLLERNQTETFKMVDVNPELSAEKKNKFGIC